MILFLWSLADAPKFGWPAALALAVGCALRLARFNSRMDADFQPHKSAGLTTGIPAPAGAGLAFVPVSLSLVTGNELFRARSDGRPPGEACVRTGRYQGVPIHKHKQTK